MHLWRAGAGSCPPEAYNSYIEADESQANRLPASPVHLTFDVPSLDVNQVVIVAAISAQVEAMVPPRQPDTQARSSR